MIDSDVLLRCGVAPVNAARWGDALAAAAKRWGIITNIRQAHWLAQLLHESRMLSVNEENLNYSVAGILATWSRKTFPEDLARQYGRIDGTQRANPEAIANIAYANRMGNGSVKSGDGYRYRGRGPIQITGRDNYAACGEALGLDLLKYPDLLLIPANGAQSAGWFWAAAEANHWADSDDVEQVSAAINGRGHDGRPNGLEDRMALTRRTMEALA